MAVFHDVDTPDQGWYDHSCAYIGNIRAMGEENRWEPLTGSTDGWKQRQFATIKRQSEVMLIWCGAVDAGTGVNYGVYYPFPNGLDNYQMYGGHAFCYPLPSPPPPAPTFQQDWYNNPISLGAPLGIGGNPSSLIAGSVTPTYLKLANADYMKIGVYNGVFGWDSCWMRFRHLKNTTCNFLFCDGHVESRRLGTVVAKDICLNPKK